MNRSFATRWGGMVACAFLGACGGNAVSSSSLTSPTVPGATTQSWTLRGKVVNAVDGAPVAGASVSLAGSVVSADGSGAFVITGSGGDRSTAVESATSLRRETVIDASATNVTIDVVSTAAPFSEDAYRELAFNGKDSPQALDVLRRWTTQPQYFVHTVADDGQPVPTAFVDFVAKHIRLLVPQYTAGRYAGIVDGGPTPPSGADLVTVEFVHADTAARECGSRTFSCANVAASPGRIWYNLDVWASTLSPGCPGNPLTIGHEIAHSLGFRHTNLPGSLVNTAGQQLVGRPGPTYCTDVVSAGTLEQFFAKVIYARPVGTSFPDRSPAGFRLAFNGPRSVVIDP